MDFPLYIVVMEKTEKIIESVKKRLTNVRTCVIVDKRDEVWLFFFD